MGVFDQAGRYLLKSNPAAFFTWRMQRLVDRFLFLGWRDTTTLAFPGEPDRICDTVAEFAPREGDGPRRLLDVECQSEPHPDMLERLGEYAYRLRRGIRYGEEHPQKYRVVSVLLNLTGPAQPAELDMREDDLDGAGSHLRLVLVTFTEEDAATLAGVASGELSRGVLPWVPLMRGGGEAGIIAEWRRLALTEPSDQRRADYGGLALVFAELAGRRAAWDQALEDWNVRQSQQVLEWQKVAVTEHARRDLLRLLEVRHSTAVPPDLAAMVAASNDLDELSRWFDIAARADSLDAFRAGIGQVAESSAPPSAGNGA
jgi:hypothetical protein